MDPNKKTQESSPITTLCIHDTLARMQTSEARMLVLAHALQTREAIFARRHDAVASLSKLRKEFDDMTVELGVDPSGTLPRELNDKRLAIQAKQHELDALLTEYYALVGWMREASDLLV